MITWRIWYIDGYIDGVTQEDWNAAPDDGVLGVTALFAYGEAGCKLTGTFYSSDWYWMDNGVISANYESADEVGVWVDHNAPSTAVLKRGRYATQERIDEVEQQMTAWVS